MLWKLGSAFIKHSHCTHHGLLRVGQKFTATKCNHWICLCVWPGEMNQNSQQLIFLKLITLAFYRINATELVLLLSLLSYGYSFFFFLCSLSNRVTIRNSNMKLVQGKALVILRNHIILFFSLWSWEMSNTSNFSFHLFCPKSQSPTWNTTIGNIGAIIIGIFVFSFPLL